jgi:hypothetical protein
VSGALKIEQHPLLGVREIVEPNPGHKLDYMSQYLNGQSLPSRRERKFMRTGCKPNLLSVLLLSSAEKELSMTLYGDAKRLRHFHRVSLAAAPFRSVKIELGTVL